MHFEVLVEEPSAKAALDALLPKVLGEEHTFEVHPFQCKSEMLANLLPRLRGYASWFQSDPTTEHWRILLLIDEDRQDCRDVKRKLLDAAQAAGLSDRVLARVIIEELEAWFFGDIEAVRTVYPRVPATLAARRGFRNPDAITGGTWEALDRVLRQSGYGNGLQKIRFAAAVAPQMQPERNTSGSFQALRIGLQRMISRVAD